MLGLKLNHVSKRGHSNLPRFPRQPAAKQVYQRWCIIEKKLKQYVMEIQCVKL